MLNDNAAAPNNKDYDAFWDELIKQSAWARKQADIPFQNLNVLKKEESKNIQDKEAISIATTELRFRAKCFVIISLICGIGLTIFVYLITTTIIKL